MAKVTRYIVLKGHLLPGPPAITSSAPGCFEWEYVHKSSDYDALRSTLAGVVEALEQINRDCIECATSADVSVGDARAYKAIGMLARKALREAALATAWA